MLLCTLGNPLPYITSSYPKATSFVIENNVSPIEYIINIVRQEKSHRTKKVPYMVSVRFFEYMKVCHTYSLKQNILHNLQRKSLLRIQQLTITHTVQ